MVARAILGQPRLLVVDGVLDQFDHAEEREQLVQLLFGAEAPWTLVCVTDEPGLLARCSRVVTLRGGQLGERGREAEVQA